ncbi:MAG: hypothetical protein IPM06_06385 [Rhizobiales bacterium]|nr:hypothetical protein [Hyphomicrobiales bacterium]
MPNPDSENPDLVKQHVEKGRMGDRELQRKAGKPPGTPDPDDRTPPRQGDPEQVENVAGREQRKPNRPSDDEKTHPTGRNDRK